MLIVSDRMVSLFVRLPAFPSFLLPEFLSAFLSKNSGRLSGSESWRLIRPPKWRQADDDVTLFRLIVYQLQLFLFDTFKRQQLFCTEQSEGLNSIVDNI